MSTSIKSDDYLAELIQRIAIAISDDSSITVDVSQPTQYTRDIFLTINCTNQSSYARLLGKDGNTLKAFQRIIAAMAWRTGYSFRISLKGPEDLREVAV